MQYATFYINVGALDNEDKCPLTRPISFDLTL